MGYDSTFSGSLHPSKPIPDEIVKIINGADRNIFVQPDGEEGLEYDGEPGDIVPVSRVMHGYTLPEDVFIISRLLKDHGIRLSGEIDRDGEDSTDHERITVRNGRVYTAQAELVYRNKREITSEDITHYAVRVTRQDDPVPKFLGWLSRGVCDKTARLIRCAKKCDVLPPPLTVTKFDTVSEAREAISVFDRADDIRCTIVSWEDPL